MNKAQRYLLVCGIFPLFLFSVGCVRQVRSTAQTGGYDLGPYRLSVYWVAHERWYPGPKRASFFVRGRRVAWVNRSFARAVRLQGSGVLRNGWLVKYKGQCRDRQRFCLRVRVLSRKRFPASIGAAGIPLTPLRSLAVDTRQIAFGTSLYIPELGKLLRQRGRRHDGCFVAHDRGHRIRGARIDLFVGRRELYRATLKNRIPDQVHVFINHPRCQTYTAQR